MVIYTVRPGDSLYSIARRYGTTAQRLAFDNGINDPSYLTVGQSIVILEPLQTYTVRRGDTLYSIANSFGVSLDQLWRNNPSLLGGDNVEEGQLLYITLPSPEIDRSITVIGYAYPFINGDILRSTLPYLTYLSVFSYGLSSDGSLIPIDDGEIIATAREYGVVPIMMLTSINEEGFFSSGRAELLLSNPEIQDRFIDDVVRLVNERGYGGVEFDYEYIPTEFADDYAALITRTRERLAPSGKVVFADLAPKESDNKQGLLYEGHDYRAVGSAADKVLLMTYEYGYTYGPPMAVAPVGPVSRVAEYAVGVIPPDKILLGEPNYGYDWTLPYVEGESRARSLSNVEAVELAAERGVAIEYNEVSQAPFFNYYEQTENGPVLHEVWFSDARSVDASLRLIDRYGIDGTGVWNIMRYFPQFWLVLNSLYGINKVL